MTGIAFNQWYDFEHKHFATIGVVKATVGVDDPTKHNLLAFMVLSHSLDAHGHVFLLFLTLILLPVSTRRDA